MGHMGTYMVHVPLHVFRLIVHRTLPKCYWGLLSLIMLIWRSTGCFKWYFWIFEHLAKCTNGHCQCHWCSNVSRSGQFTSIWHFDIFFNLNHLSPSQGYFCISVYQVLKVPFLGGLSLHLNHLIGSQLAISFQQFGTLPIGVLLSNLDSRQLMTYPRTPFGPFWHMLIFGDSRAVWVLLSKWGAFRKSIFSRWRSNGASKCSGGFRWAGPWAIW